MFSLQESVAEPIDEEFQRLNLMYYGMCQRLSEALPVEQVPNPGIRRFGRQHFFHMCVLVSLRCGVK